MKTIYHMDCLELDPLLIKDCKLLYVDPPYGPESMDKYFGVMDTVEGYVEWLSDRLKHLTYEMTDFNIVVHVDPKCGHYVKVAMDRLFGIKNFKNEIAWCYSGPSVCKAA